MKARTPSYLTEVKKRFGEPRVDHFPATFHHAEQYRVWIDRFHVHDGASTHDVVGYGRTLEAAAQDMIERATRPGAAIVAGRCPGDECHLRYTRSHDAVIARKEFWRRAKEMADESRERRRQRDETK